MPFDTTYRFVNKNDTLKILTITIPGGKDSVINKDNSELPEFVVSHPEIKETVHQYWLSQNPFVKADEEFNTSMALIEVAVLIVLLWIGYRIKKNPSIWKIALEKINATKIVLLLFAVLLTTLFFAGNVLLGWPALVFILIVAGEFRNELLYPNKTTHSAEEFLSTQSNINIVNKPVLKYKGADLNFTDAEIDIALTKRFPYYEAINFTEKERFIHRVKNFISAKIFFIHDKSGFKEMPILISAAAIQLTFGLKKYLLPYFKNIHVYPEEFFRSNNMGVCFLEGNVSGNDINLSWKHFLKGYRESTDGQNVGLHELAHALYYQTFVVGENVDDNFKGSFGNFINYGDKAYHTEKTVAGGLYSDYAVKDFQEFWAESAEIFFERPAQMREFYPELYEAMKTLLKQDLLNDPGSPVS